VEDQKSLKSANTAELGLELERCASTGVRPYLHREGLIYCIFHPNGYVKLGWSIDPVKRLLQLQSSSLTLWPNNERAVLKLIGYFPGTMSYEQDAHRRFSNYCISGNEWYPRDSPAADWFFSHRFTIYNGAALEIPEYSVVPKSESISFDLRWDLSTIPPDIIPYDLLSHWWGRRSQSKRKTYGAGPGRPKSTERCPCGAMTKSRAIQRNHQC
jgi:hypothetical protein